MTELCGGSHYDSLWWRSVSSHLLPLLEDGSCSHWVSFIFASASVGLIVWLLLLTSPCWKESYLSTGSFFYSAAGNSFIKNQSQKHCAPSAFPYRQLPPAPVDSLLLLPGNPWDNLLLSLEFRFSLITFSPSASLPYMTLPLPIWGNQLSRLFFLQVNLLAFSKSPHTIEMIVCVCIHIDL